MPEPILLQFDDYDLEGFIKVAADFGQNEFGYVVTPNTDHLIRYHDDASFRVLYADARYVLLDSRFLSYLFKLLRGVSLPVCAGSDLTSAVFRRVIQPDDKLVLIGATEPQAQQLRVQLGLKNLQHYNPPMGFIKDSIAVEACLQFIEQHSPARFLFLAIGSPQQEVIAQHIKQRNRFHGMGLCIGASINFMTGDERRAPHWMQRMGCEWLYRLLQDPRRLAKRYLVRGPRIFVLLRHIRVGLRNKT